GGNPLDGEAAQPAYGVDPGYEEFLGPGVPEGDRETQRCAFDSRNRLRRFDQLSTRGCRHIVAQLEAAGIGIDVENRVYIVSQADSIHIAETPDEQSGSHQQYHRENRLEEEQSGSRPRAAIAPLS